jgi:ubiquinone/menaquinone biosynthesis C-methylase UbiE
MANKDTFKEPWKEFAVRWQKYYTAPGRPSKEAIRVYKNFCNLAAQKSKKQKRALVLGSTPELRDLLYELKFEVTMIDINLEMILAMSQLIKKNNPNEIIVRNNWLLTNLPSNYYDIILGDLVISNIPADKQNDFLKELKRILKPNGHWITKIEIVPDGWLCENNDKILDKFSELSKAKNRAMELFCFFLNNFWDKKTRIINIKKIKNWMDKYRQKNGKYVHPDKKITAYLNEIWEMWKPMEKCWICRGYVDTIRQLQPYFKIVNKRVLHDCYHKKIDESYPIWLCRVKK